ncbi:MAG: hypothetical protein ACK56S_10025 [Planctomycetota bacterium]
MTSRLAAARPNRPPHRSSRRRKSCAGASLRTLLPGFGLLVLLAQAGSAQSAPQRPADPARAAAGAAGAARDPFAESNQGTGVIGPGGGVVGTPDGEFEVEWVPNAARRRTRAIVAHDGDPEVKGFGIDGPPGPVIVRWFPPRAILPAGPEVQTPTPPTPPPTPPPEPVVIIEEGNGEWREVEPQPSPKGGKQIRIEDDLAPIRAVGGIAPAFRVAPDRGYVRVKERIQFQLVGLTPRPRPQPIEDDELAPLPKRPQPIDDDELAPLPKRPPAAPASDDDDDLAPIAKLPPAAKVTDARVDAVVDAAAGRLLQRMNQRRAARDAERQKALRRARILHWEVDGIRGGNATVGVIGRLGDEDPLLADTVGSAVSYTAPARLPATRERRITAVVDVGGKRAVYATVLTLLDRGECEVQVSARFTFTRNQTVAGTKDSITARTSTREDAVLDVTGSFLARVFDDRDGGAIRTRVYSIAGPAPLSLAYDERSLVDWEESGPGEYGSRWTKTQAAGRVRMSPAVNLFEMSLQTSPPVWTIKQWPIEQWLSDARLKASGETIQVHSGHPWRIAYEKTPMVRLDGVLQQIRTREAPAVIAPATFAGTIDRSVDLADGRAYLRLQWSVRRP